MRFHDRKFLRENRTEKITKSPIQAFRREWIPLLGPDNFKFNDTPIELETSHTIIGSLVQHPVSFLSTGMRLFPLWNLGSTILYRWKTESQQ